MPLSKALALIALTLPIVAAAEQCTTTAVAKQNSFATISACEAELNAMEKKPRLERSLDDTAEIKRTLDLIKGMAGRTIEGAAIASQAAKVEVGHQGILSRVDVGPTPEKAPVKATDEASEKQTATPKENGPPILNAPANTMADPDPCLGGNLPACKVKIEAARVAAIDPRLDEEQHRAAIAALRQLAEQVDHKANWTIEERGDPEEIKDYKDLNFKTEVELSGVENDYRDSRKGAPPGETPPEDEKQMAADASRAEQAAVKSEGAASQKASEAAGREFLGAGQPKDAERNFRRVLSKAPDDKPALEGLIRALTREGRLDEAREQARHLAALDPKNPIALILAGHSDGLSRAQSSVGKAGSLGKGQGPEGLSKGGGPTGTNAAGDLPLAVSQPGDYERAAAQLTPAPDFSPAVQKAIQSRRMGDKSTALFLLSQAVDADPKDAAAWTVRSEVKSDFQNFPGAVSDAKRALDLHPSPPLSARALRAKAYAEIEQGDFGAALTDISLAIELEPDNGLSLFYRAMAEEKLGRTADALRDYDKSDDLDPSLTPLTTEAFQRLGAIPGQSSELKMTASWDIFKHRHLLRGGSTALAAVLILIGLLGATAAKHLTTRGARAAARESDTPTGLDPTPVSISAGTTLGGNYRVTGELGRGGMGVVYDAIDDALQRRVAIKQLQRDENTTSDDLDRFLREARLVAQLKHPNLAEIYSVINEGDLFLVFEYVDGQPLDKILRLNGRRRPDQTRRILSDIASALDYAHERKIIHRDLKPSNIMITEDGSAKIMDFGIAHQSQSASGLTKTSASGTPPYMAPEQALGSVSKAADLYALAVMAYELLTGTRPFEGPDFLEQKLRKRFIPPSQRDPNLRRDLDAFFSSALDPDPTKRPESAKDFLRRFEGACAALP